jgi:predicted metalloprotease with PDZ domain
MKIFYKIDFSEKDQKYVHIKQIIDLEDYSEKHLNIIMPVWSPGSYLIREYSKILDCFKIIDENNNNIFYEKISKNNWEINLKKNKKLYISYRLYCNEFSVRNNFVDDKHALLVGPSTFLIPDNKKNCDYFEVEIELPKEWNKITTGLEPVKNSTNKFYQTDVDDFLDCPIEVGDYDVYEFEVFNKPHRIAMIGAKVYDENVLVKDIKKVIESTARLIGDVPYEHYDFITHLTSNSTGGIEHKNSCILHFNRWDFQEPEKYKKSWLSLVSHEYFHLWNVKRIKPKELSDFDYNSENYTKLLWFSEGFTSYFDDLILKRSGIYNNLEYISVLTDLINRLIQIPGRFYQTVEESSFDAWTKFYRKHENSNNQQISYYVKGAQLALVLDLQIRKNTNHEKSLDNLLEMLWADFKKDSSIGFTKENIISYVNQLGGNLDDIFYEFLETTNEIDYNKYLNYAGLRLKISDNNKPTLDMDIKEDKGLFICSFIKDKGTAYQAGVMVNDEIIAIDGYRLTQTNINKRFKNMYVGQNINLLISRDERLLQKSITVSASKGDAVKIEMIENQTKEQINFLNEWLKEYH